MNITVTIDTGVIDEFLENWNLDFDEIYERVLIELGYDWKSDCVCDEKLDLKYFQIV